MMCLRLIQDILRYLSEELIVDGTAEGRFMCACDVIWRFLILTQLDVCDVVIAGD